MAYTRNPNSVLAGTALQQTPDATPLTPAGILPVRIDAKIATTSSLGVVQIGDNITVDENGVISVDKCECDNECKNKTVLVSTDYQALYTDFYIGVNSSKPVTITLPANPDSGSEIIVKVEMKPPIGNKKITVKTNDGSLIDGQSTYVMEIGYQFVRVIRRDNNWYII